jgi:hypothetical protein
MHVDPLGNPVFRRKQRKKQITTSHPRSLLDDLEKDSDWSARGSKPHVLMAFVLLKTVIRPGHHLASSFHALDAQLLPGKSFLQSKVDGSRAYSTIIGLNSKIQGQSGRWYTLDRVLQRKQDPSQTVYQAL